MSHQRTRFTANTFVCDEAQVHIVLREGVLDKDSSVIEVTLHRWFLYSERNIVGGRVRISGF